MIFPVSVIIVNYRDSSVSVQWLHPLITCLSHKPVFGYAEEGRRSVIGRRDPCEVRQCVGEHQVRNGGGFMVTKL